MKFTVEREHLLKPLQQVSGPLGGRPTLPILGNLLLQVADGTLSLTGTDLEMEMVARVALIQPHEPGATTVPARKFFDICRGLPEGAEIAVQLEGDRMLVRSGRSRFSLSTLPAADFPNLDDWQSEVEFTLPQATMKRLIEATVRKLPFNWKATVCWCVLAAAVSRCLRCLQTTSRIWTTGRAKSNSPCRRRR